MGRGGAGMREGPSWKNERNAAARGARRDDSAGRAGSGRERFRERRGGGTRGLWPGRARGDGGARGTRPTGTRREARVGARSHRPCSTCRRDRCHAGRAPGQRRGRGGCPREPVEAVRQRAHRPLQLGCGSFPAPLGRGQAPPLRRSAFVGAGLVPARYAPQKSRTQWVRVPAPTRAVLSSVQVVSEDEIHACGAGYRVLEGSVRGWAEPSSPRG
jgi:hypothetical protein